MSSPIDPVYDGGPDNQFGLGVLSDVKISFSEGECPIDMTHINQYE